MKILNFSSPNYIFTVIKDEMINKDGLTQMDM